MKHTAATQKAILTAMMPLQSNGAFSELAKQASLYQSAFSTIKPLQANGVFSELTKQFSANKKIIESTDEPE